MALYFRGYPAGGPVHSLCGCDRHGAGYQAHVPISRAEHKTIFCYENDLPLTVENVRKQRRFHPRCGTSFLILMLVLGIIVGFFIPFSNPFLRTFTKLLCIPVIMNIGYELQKVCARHDNLLSRIVTAPGLWMQRLTVKEPDDKMMEAAITAMEAVIPENGEDLIK